jgi:phage head maturation protease
MELIERGDVSQSSFAFRATKEEWDETGDLPVRTVLECELFDVSPVTYPAYDDSEVGLRKVGEKILAEARSAGLVRPSAIAGLDPLKLRMRAGLDLRLRNRSRL